MEPIYGSKKGRYSRRWILKDLGIAERTLRSYVDKYLEPCLGTRLGFTERMHWFDHRQYNAIRLVHKMLARRSWRSERSDGTRMTGHETVIDFLENTRMNWNTLEPLEDYSETRRIA